MNLSSAIDPVIAHLPRFLRQYAVRVRSSPIWSRMARGTFWVLVGSTVARVLALLASLITAPILGVEGFGSLGVIYSTIGLFTIFAGMHMGLTATKFVAQYRIKDPQKAGQIIGICEVIAAITSLVVAAVFFTLAPWLAAKTLNAPQLSGLLRIASLQLLFTAFYGAQLGALAGLEAFREQSLVSFVVGVAAFPMTLCGVYWGGIEGATWAIVANAALGVPLAYWALERQARRNGIVIRRGLFRGEMSMIWSFSLPAVLTGITAGPVTWACTTVLMHTPSGLSEMGFLYPTNWWFGSVIFLPAVIGTVMLPAVSERMGSGDSASARRVLTVLLKLTVLVAGPIVVLAALASPFIIRWYGKGFAGHWQPLAIVFFTGWVYAIQTPLGQVVMAAGKMWATFAANLVLAAIFLGGTVLLDRWGATGFSAAKLAAYAVVTVWYFFAAYSALKPKNLPPALPKAEGEAARQTTGLGAQGTPPAV